MIGVLERLFDAALVTVTAFVAVSFLLAVLGAVRWSLRRIAGAVFTDRPSAPPINPT